MSQMVRISCFCSCLPEVIIKFRKYHPLSEHSAILSVSLSRECRRRTSIINRNLPDGANDFPSDFALVHVEGESCSLIEENWSNSTYIFGVFNQRKYHIVQLSRHADDDLTESTDSEEDYQGDAAISSDQLSGRMHTRFSFGLSEDDDMEYFGAVDDDSEFNRTRRSLLCDKRSLQSVDVPQITHLMKASQIWEKGATGQGIKVAVFDTGLQKGHPHFRNIISRTDWTDENTNGDDGLGHGTFVAGVIASQSECFGFAPDVDIHIFRVFTNKQVSFTSWFLDSFNYAIFTSVDILNLSIGGPDFEDKPFVEKVREMSANGITVVSAIGNDGPLYGTLNNPADMMDVIGVGGLSTSDDIAPFSSRGMTTWELPSGGGRVKPDVVVPSIAIHGSRPHSGCRALSGTSVASPVVTGIVALFASSIDKSLVNPASMKQALHASAVPVPNANIFEQGAGKVDPYRGYEYLQSHTPRATLFPRVYDLTQPKYMWPLSAQPLYHTGQTTILNATLLNSMDALGYIDTPPHWIPKLNGERLSIHFAYSKIVWPWSGHVAIFVDVASDWEGVAMGTVEVVVKSPPRSGEDVERSSIAYVDLVIPVIKTPHRSKRILFDQFHSLRYPPGYFPRDALYVRNDPLDWNGDHLYTNYGTLFSAMLDAGYYVEILGLPMTCFNGTNYGTLMIVDSEDEFFDSEVSKVADDVEKLGMSLLVVGEWYNIDVIRKARFFDDNTHHWWTPVTGGAHLPGLNTFLKPYGVSFGDKVFRGEIRSAGHTAMYDSGTSVHRAPAGSLIGSWTLTDETMELIGTGSSSDMDVPVIALIPSDSGRVALFGDSSCLDDAHLRGECTWLLKSLVHFCMTGDVDSDVLPNLVKQDSPFVSKHSKEPRRLSNSDLRIFSHVLGQKSSCERDLVVGSTTSQASRAREVVGGYVSSESSHWFSVYFVALGVLCIGIVALLIITWRRRFASRKRGEEMETHDA